MFNHININHANEIEIQSKSKVKRNTKHRDKDKFIIRTGRMEKKAIENHLSRKYYDIVSLDENDQEIPLSCVGTALDVSRYKIVAPHLRKYRNRFGGMKFMIHLKLRMEKAIKSPDENDDEEIRWFNSKMEILESMNEFDDIYSKQTSKIWNEISDKKC